MLTFYSSSFFVEKKNVQDLGIFFIPPHPHNPLPLPKLKHETKKPSSEVLY